jgi:ABC-type polysaccharide/polyol phosphate export permease
MEVLPGVLRKLAVISPATYVLDGARQALLEGATPGTLWPNIWPALMMGAILIPMGYGCSASGTLRKTQRKTAPEWVAKFRSIAVKSQSRAG